MSLLFNKDPEDMTTSDLMKLYKSLKVQKSRGRGTRGLTVQLQLADVLKELESRGVVVRESIEVLIDKVLRSK